MRYKIEKIEQRVNQKEEKSTRWEERKGKEIIEKVIRIEKSLENKEKERRKRNIVIKGAKGGEGRRWRRL